MFTGQAPLSVHIRSEYIDVHCREGGMAMLVCACVSVCTRACIRLCVYLCVFVNINYRCINNLYINIIFFFKTQLWITAVTIENRCKQCIFISTAFIRVRRKTNRPDQFQSIVVSGFYLRLTTVFNCSQDIGIVQRIE